MKRPLGVFPLAVAFLSAAACTGAEAVMVGNTVMAASAVANPLIMREIDGIPGWKRQGPPERYSRDGLYGYIDGGAEIVLPYGFRELSVFKFKPAKAEAAPKEIVVEIYRMASGTGAFGLYSTKLEGGEEGWPGIKTDNWISRGQANLVQSDYLVNILAPECTDREIGEFAAALEKRIPGSRAVRPKGLDRLPREGMVSSSWRYIKGPLAAQNESPFLEGDFWGFGGDAEKGATVAYSAKYGTAPAVSKLVIVELRRGLDVSAVDDGVLAHFNEYLQDFRREGGRLEGRNQASRWFLYEREGALAALVLGDPDVTTARARLEAATALTTQRSPSRR